MYAFFQRRIIDVLFFARFFCFGKNRCAVIPKGGEGQSVKESKHCRDKARCLQERKHKCEQQHCGIGGARPDEHGGTAHGVDERESAEPPLCVRKMVDKVRCLRNAAQDKQIADKIGKDIENVYNRIRKEEKACQNETDVHRISPFACGFY